MPLVRPTFSESWYRVAPLKARLRPSAQVSRQYYRGERWYVVRDPAGNQFHRLSDAAYRFVGLLDGRRTVAEAWDLVGGQLADDAPTQPEVIQILSQLYSANLVEADITPDATVLLRRHKQLQKRQLQGRLMNVLFPRIPMWDPDRFLKLWMPVTRLMLSKFGAALWLAVVFGAVWALVGRWGELRAGAADAISPGNWPFLWLTFVLIKFIHELGHASSCRRFGGEVHEMGIMFLVFIPTPYVDASTAWAFANKWQRVFVGAGGMIVELFVAALCAFVWINTAPGSLVHQLTYNAMLIASVSTVIFNANPLLRYDGYYILSDLLEIPNLRQRSVEYALGLIKRHVFRVKLPQPLPPVGQRVWLFLYAVLSGIYRIFIGIMIIVVVAWTVPVLGILMALGGVATWILMPLFKLGKYLMLEPELHRKRGRAFAFTLAVATGIFVLIGLIPFWVYYEAVGIVECRDRQVVHMAGGGFVNEIKARHGQSLRRGDAILVAQDPQLDAEIVQLEANLRGLEAQRQLAGVHDQAQRQIAEIRIGAIRERLEDAVRRRDGLTVRAPIDGELIAPQLEEMMHTYLPRGQEVAIVATTSELVAKAALEQRDAELAALVSDPNPQIRLAGAIGTVLRGHDAQLINAAQDKLPSASLGHAGGGEIATDPRDASGRTPMTRQFEMRVMLDNPSAEWFPGQRAYIRFRLDKRPLLWQWGRRFWQLLQTHSAKSKWM